MKKESIMTPQLSLLLHALATGDDKTLLGGIGGKGGIDVHWRDARGFTFLHFAAQNGNAALCDALIHQKGADARLRNSFGETPADIAAVFGHTDLSARLRREAVAQDAVSPAALPKIESLAALRAQSVKEKRNLFYDYARAGSFDLVIAAARTNKEEILPQDLLSEGQAGDSVLFQLATARQLDQLLDPALWQGRGEVLAQIWACAPERHRNDEAHVACQRILLPSQQQNSAPTRRATPRFRK